MQLARMHHLAPFSDARLVEAAMGTWEGFVEPRLSSAVLRTRRSISAGTDRTVSPPGGESIADVQTRVLACVHDLAQRHSGAAVVVVSHVARSGFLCAAMDVPLTAARRMISTVPR